MTEVRVTKEPKTEHTEAFPWSGFEAPLARGGFFGVKPPDTWRPAIEVKEEKGNLRVTAELPGVKKEDVRVYVRNDALVVEGERTYEKEEKREAYFHTERSYGRFYRAIPLLELADAAKATARFNNGVLNVAIPIPAILPKTREIPISEGTSGKADTTH